MISKYLFAGVALLTCTSGAYAFASDALPTYRPSVDAEIDFPGPGKATRKDGVFVPARHVAMVTPGMTKGQIYSLLDVPHFHEGLFGVRRWDYILNFYTGEGDQYVPCQYQIRFDRKVRVEGTWFREQKCADLLDRQLAPQSAAIATDPAMPAAASSAAPVRTYAFTFAFDSSQVTPQAIEVLRNAALDVRQNGYREAIVTGFTDTMGSVGYNDALAARRAAAVAQELRAMIGDVPVYARSARDLDAPSGPSVRDERNRRVIVEVYAQPVNRPAPALDR